MCVRCLFPDDFHCAASSQTLPADLRERRTDMLCLPLQDVHASFGDSALSKICETAMQENERVADRQSSIPLSALEEKLSTEEPRVSPLQPTDQATQANSAAAAATYILPVPELKTPSESHHWSTVHAPMDPDSRELLSVLAGADVFCVSCKRGPR